MRFNEYVIDIKKKKIALTLIIIFTIIGSCYIGSIGYIAFDLMYETTEGEIDSEDLIPIDINLIRSMGYELEISLEKDHLPLQYPLGIYWNENQTSIERYETGGDAAGFVGVLLGAEGFRYAKDKKAQNNTAIAESLAMIKTLLNATSYFYRIPNGGLGPNYSAILARCWTPPNYSGPTIILGGEPGKDIFPGKGIYENYTYLGYPSNDHLSGIIFGLSLIAHFVGQDDPWIANITSLLTQQIVEHFISTNFMQVDGNGRTTGQQISYGIEVSAYWVLSLLKMAILGNPQNIRYQQLYYHYAYERDYAHLLKPVVPNGFAHVNNYYAIALQYYTVFPLVITETDPYLAKIYQKLIYDEFYTYTKTSRNAFFNVAYLGMSQEKDVKLSLDIGDQMMRFNILSEIDNSTKIPVHGEPQTSIPESQFGRPRNTYWREFFENNTFGKTFYGWLEPILIKEDHLILNKPKTVDQYPAEDSIWERNPWQYHENWGSRTLREDPGLDYLLVYYMAEYYEIWSEI